MPSIQIKDVPADVHAVLRERAANAHQSLQEYLLKHLIAEAGRPSADEVWDRIATRSGGNIAIEDVVAGIREDRDRH